MPFRWQWLALASALAVGFGLLWLLYKGEPCCPELPVGTNVEGDGRTAWLLGQTLLTIPQGMSVRIGEARTYRDPHRFTTTYRCGGGGIGSEIPLIDVASGAVLMLDAMDGWERDRLIVGNLADPDVDARFDAIADSARPAPEFRERWRGGPEEWREYDDRCRPMRR